MITVHEIPPVVQPKSWVLVFDRQTDRWWCRLLVWGRYKHVRAYAYVPGIGCWVFYDVRLGGTDIKLARDGDAAVAFIGAFTKDSDLMRMAVRPDAPHRFRIGFWCVPAIKHLIGLRSGALRPSTLYGDCIAAGGVPQEPADESQRTGSTGASLHAPARACPGAG